MASSLDQSLIDSQPSPEFQGASDRTTLPMQDVIDYYSVAVSPLTVLDVTEAALMRYSTEGAILGPE